MPSELALAAAIISLGAAIAQAVSLLGRAGLPRLQAWLQEHWKRTLALVVIAVLDMIGTTLTAATAVGAASLADAAASLDMPVWAFVVAGIAGGMFYIVQRVGLPGRLRAWAAAMGTPPQPSAPLPPPESMKVRASSGVVALQNVHVGGDLHVYVDGLPDAKEPEVRDHFREGRRLQNDERHREAIQEFLNAFTAEQDERQRSTLHILTGNSFRRLSKLQEADGHYRQALALAEEAGHMPDQAAALGNLGLVYWRRGDLDQAEEHHKRALAIDEEIGNKLGQAGDLGNLGLVYWRRGDLDQAEEHYKRALAIDEEMGNKLGQAVDLGNLGNVYHDRGDLDRAEQHHKRALAIDEEIGDRLVQAQILGNLGLIYWHRGDLDKAAEHHRRALAIQEEIGDRLGQAHQLGNLGNVYARRGDLGKAEGHYRQALALFEEIDARPEIAHTQRLLEKLRSAGQGNQ